MKIDTFLKSKQVRFIGKDNRLDLTNGRVYDVIGVAHERIKVHTDNGGSGWYDMDCFELVSDPSEKPPQVARSKFKVGDKVYLFGKKHIFTIKLAISDNQYLIDRLPRAQDVRDLVLATQENYEKLCILFECIDFEQPPTQADIDNEAVDKLAQAMKNKLAKKREQGYHGWETCKHGDLVQLLINHVDKGDPIDVANFCAFLFARGEQLIQGGT